MKTSWPTLYKKSSKGKIEQWQISVTEVLNGSGTITTVFGELGGKQQETSDVIKEGKNIGKKNETSAGEQASAEAQSKYEKKLKSGYVDSLEKAESGEVDAIIEGGIIPMLAHSFADHASKIQFPCAGQPKLDGVRCIAIKGEDGEVTLWTRTRKQITSCPHIIEALKKCFNTSGTFDGELYNHEYKNDFSKIISAVRKDKPTPEALKVQYHIYDFVIPGFPGPQTFTERNSSLLLSVEGESQYIEIVPTSYLADESCVPTYFTVCRNAGYEGAMVRNWDGEYENKRSYNLQKVKDFETDEFEIVRVNEGRGKLAGHAATFTCLTSEGVEFEAKMTGDTSRLKDFLIDECLWRGKKLTVKFQGMTDANNVPRFPVGVEIRDYE